MEYVVNWMVGVLAMAVLICKEEAVLSITVICYMCNCTAWRGILPGILRQSNLGMASKLKMYHVFQNFPNRQFTQLKGVWLILVNMLSLCLGNNLKPGSVCVCGTTVIFILVCSAVHDFRNHTLWYSNIINISIICFSCHCYSCVFSFWELMSNRTFFWGAWVAWSVKRPTLDFGSGHDLGVVRWSSTLGFTHGMEPT